MNRFVKLLTIPGRSADWLRAFVSLVLIALIAQLMAVITWDLVTFRKTRPLAPLAPAAKGPAGQQGKVGATGPDQALLNLFGQPGPGPALIIPSQATTVESIPKSTLGLVLKGIIGLKPKKRALALISEKDKTIAEEVYGIGDMVAGVAELKEIYSEHVVLMRAGKLEILQLEEEVRAISAPAGEQEPAKVARTGPDIINRGDGIHWQVNQGYLKERLADLPSLAKEVGLDAYRENNMQKGYRLISTRGSKMLEDLGLKPGDVLLEVNGIKLIDAHRGLLAYQKLRDAQEISMAIERNGTPKTMIYSIGKN